MPPCSTGQLGAIPAPFVQDLLPSDLVFLVHARAGPRALAHVGRQPFSQEGPHFLLKRALFGSQDEIHDPGPHCFRRARPRPRCGRPPATVSAGADANGTPGRRAPTGRPDGAAAGRLRGPHLMLSRAGHGLRRLLRPAAGVVTAGRGGFPPGSSGSEYAESPCRGSCFALQRGCWQQIELSGFVAQGLSVFPGSVVVVPGELVGERRESVGKAVGNAPALSTVLSTRPAGLAPVRRTRPQIHRPPRGAQRALSRSHAPVVPGAVGVCHQGPIGFVVGEPARPMEHRQAPVGVTMHPHPGLDEVAAVGLGGELEPLALEAHAVVRATVRSWCSHSASASPEPITARRHCRSRLRAPRTPR